jgi:5'/3'-nucleotidase SurE
MVTKILPRFRCVCGLLLGMAILAPAASLADEQTRALRILLTNDDGIDAPGIEVMQDALIAAGHQVTVVAPLRDQSGSGMRVTISGVLETEERSSGWWSVDGFPADSVLVGIQTLFPDGAPDLVVSGANFGPNLGFASSSGTVGAATMAMFLGVPAIAVSVGVNPSEHDATPIPFPSTFKAFAGAAKLTSDLIRDLSLSRIDSESLLPESTLLSVNYPPLDAQDLQGVRVLPATADVGVRIDYLPTGQKGQLRVNLRMIEPGAISGQNVDWQWLARGHATIAVLDGNTDAGDSIRKTVSARLTADSGNE